jgi:carotenoid 1,2-hydratase
VNPDFAQPVTPGGYAWWYVDALSDDGRHGLALIAFVGSVFSPYYARRLRRRGDRTADPLDHNAINVALYPGAGNGPGAGRRRWAMTERGRHALRRSADALAIGPSALHWNAGRLVVEVDEVTAPLPTRLRGRVIVEPLTTTDAPLALDAAGAHTWHPLAPRARVRVAFDRPALEWQGDAYFDANRGTAPLACAFSRWHWSRAHLPGGRVAVLYDLEPREGSARSLALEIDAAGRVRPFDAPPMTALPRTFWGIDRRTRADARCEVLRTLEDSPFYARSLLSTRLLGQPACAIHESLSLDRFASPIIQWMLPVRMPRRAGAARCAA